MLSLVLMSKKDLITTPSNGNSYLQCFLINNTDTIVSISRADATIVGFSTEILKDKVWQHFQKDLVVSCGNSFWIQKLGEQEVLSIQLDHAESGNIKIPFRIKYTHNGTALYSNAIMVDIDQKNYDRVGKMQIKTIRNAANQQLGSGTSPLSSAANIHASIQGRLNSAGL
jgi:hypothetical protein